MRRRQRSSRGGAISETGPALFFFFVLVFFPMMDLLYIVCGGAFAWFLHNTEVRELSVHPPRVDEAVNVLAKVDDDFFNNAKGIATFLNFSDANRATAIQHDTPVYTAPSNGQRGTVMLTTRFAIRPWLMLPFPPNTPGISAPIPLSFTTTKPQEENGSDG